MKRNARRCAYRQTWHHSTTTTANMRQGTVLWHTAPGLGGFFRGRSPFPQLFPAGLWFGQPKANRWCHGGLACRSLLYRAGGARPLLAQRGSPVCVLYPLGFLSLCVGEPVSRRNRAAWSSLQKSLPQSLQKMSRCCFAERKLVRSSKPLRRCALPRVGLGPSRVLPLLRETLSLLALIRLRVVGEPG